MCVHVWSFPVSDRLHWWWRLFLLTNTSPPQGLTVGKWSGKKSLSNWPKCYPSAPCKLILSQGVSWVWEVLWSSLLLTMTWCVLFHKTPEWLDSDSCQKCDQPFFWNFKQMWDSKKIGLRQVGEMDVSSSRCSCVETTYDCGRNNTPGWDWWWG